MFNGREKFWAGIVGGIVVLWVVGAVLWTAWHKQPAPGRSDADFQAAATSMRVYDTPVPVPLQPLDVYVAQLRAAAPKCTESLTQIIDLFRQTVTDQDTAQGRNDLTVLEMLSAYNNWATGQHVTLGSCTLEVSRVEPMLADSIGR